MYGQIVLKVNNQTRVQVGIPFVVCICFFQDQNRVGQTSLGGSFLQAVVRNIDDLLWFNIANYI